MSLRAGQGGKSRIAVIFAIAALGLLPACTTMNAMNKERCMEEKRSYLLGLIPTGLDSRYNEQCGKVRTAETLATQGSDPYMRAAGYGALKRLNTELSKSDDALVRQLVEGSGQMQCEFHGIDPQTGNARYGNCKKPATPSNAPKP